MAKADKTPVKSAEDEAEKAAKAEKTAAVKAEKAAHEPVPAEQKPWVCLREIREDEGTWKPGSVYTGKRVDHLAKRNCIVQK